jgi:hypothetical protein
MKLRVCARLLALLAAATVDPAVAVARAEGTKPVAAAPRATIEPRDWLLLPRVGDYSRRVLHVDPVEAALARGQWRPPTAGETLAAKAWRRDEPGSARSADLAGGYATAIVTSDEAGVWLVEAPGVAAVWIGDPDSGGELGEWLVGDPYAAGWFRAPVALGPGRHAVVAHLARPDGTVRLVAPAAGVSLVESEATLADVLVGAEDESLLGSIHLTNATREDLTDLRVIAEVEGAERIVSIAPRVAALTVARLPFRYAVPDNAKPGSIEVRITVQREAPTGGDGPSTEATDTLARVPLATATLVARVVPAAEPHLATHQSAIDGSVQGYAVVPPRVADSSASGRVVLALHDAGQTAVECAAEVGPLAGATVVAPGGRGPFGFDWEDWSARDAIEALDDFQRRANATRGRGAVVGRGMGGHGALRLATLHPDRFAAVAVLGGWVSFYSLGSAEALDPTATAVTQLLGRASSAADPLRSLTNLARSAVWVEHDRDDTAAVAESRLLRRRLAEFHGDFVYREAAPRADSAWRTFLEDRLAKDTNDPTDSDAIDFATSDPRLSARAAWATIEQPQRQGEIARVRLERDAAARVVRGSTDNVARLRIDASALAGDGPVTVRLDGGPPIAAAPRRDGVLRFARDDSGVWRRARRLPNDAKGPERAGGFKNAIESLPIAVFGTRGSDTERRWSAAKARYDAHLFLTRGAGSIEVMSDEEFLTSSPSDSEPLRSVLLYGNRATNAAYEALLGESPVLVEPGGVRVGDRPELGDGLAVLAVRPAAGDERAMVALVGGTGPVGMRLTTRLRWCWAGIDPPDLLMMGSGALDAAPEEEPAVKDYLADPSAGRGAGDVRAAGYFGPEWGVESGDIAWRDLAL